MSKPTLTVATIALNEERDLPAFLENFGYVADEIVIVDDGSTDRTVEIASSAGTHVKVIVSPRGEGEGWSGQRNKAAAAATGDWLLQVDVDMRVSPELRDEILRRIASPEFDAYRFRLKQFFVNRPIRYGGWQFWNQPWLARRGLVSWTQKLHERIVIGTSPERIGQLEQPMWHLNDDSFGERLRKNVQYSEYEADRLLAGPKPVTIGRMLFVPAWIAFRSYVPFRGFLDGRLGIVWAFYAFCSVMARYFIAWERQTHVPRESVEEAVRRGFDAATPARPGSPTGTT